MTRIESTSLNSGVLSSAITLPVFRHQPSFSVPSRRYCRGFAQSLRSSDRHQPFYALQGYRQCRPPEPFGFSGVGYGLGNAHCHGVIRAVKAFRLGFRCSTLVATSSALMRSQSAGWLATSDLSGFFECLRRTVTTGFARRVPRFTLDDGNVAALSSQFLDNKIGAFCPTATLSVVTKPSTLPPAFFRLSISIFHRD